MRVYTLANSNSKMKILLNSFQKQISYLRVVQTYLEKEPGNQKIDLKKHSKYSIEREEDQRREDKKIANTVRPSKIHIIEVSDEVDRRNSSKVIL